MLQTLCWDGRYQCTRIDSISGLIEQRVCGWGIKTVTFINMYFRTGVLNTAQELDSEEAHSGSHSYPWSEGVGASCAGSEEERRPEPGLEDARLQDREGWCLGDGGVSQRSSREFWSF